MKKRWLGVGVTAEILGVFNDRHVEMRWVLWGYRWGSRKTRIIIDISTWDNISTIFQHVPCIPCCYWTIFQQQWGYKGQKGDRTNMKQLTRGWTQNRNNYTPYIDNIYENMKQPCWGYTGSTQTGEENIFTKWFAVVIPEMCWWVGDRFRAQTSQAFKILRFNESWLALVCWNKWQLFSSAKLRHIDILEPWIPEKNVGKFT